MTSGDMQSDHLFILVYNFTYLCGLHRYQGRI